jgi:hypothetical protein
MKPFARRLLCCVGIPSMILLGGCVTQRRHVPPTAAHLPSEKILVISAVYGSGTNFADVTYRVNELLHQPSVEFFARPEWLHADPTPNWNKALVIVFETNGERRIFTTGEGGKVSVEQLLKTHARRKGKRK